MKNIRTSAVLILSVFLVVCSGEVRGVEPMGTVFTYQGWLIDANGPANGVYDFMFRLFNEPNGTGYQIPLTNDVNDIDVIDGYFTVELDFGQYAFNGDARWLEVAVRPGDSNEAHTIFSPRQQVTPAPYSIRAHIADSSADGVTGSGTTNRLARFTATKVVSDSAICESGDKVGIGTTSPESRLHVEQSAGAWGEGFRLGYSGHTWDIVSDSSGGRLFIAADQDGSSGLVIHDGKVGVGEASPLAHLHVQRSNQSVGADAMSIDDVIVEDTDAGLGLYSLNDGANGSGIALGDVEDGALNNKWGIYRTTMGNNSRLHISFGTNKDVSANTTYLTITPGGNVGIGTEVPLGKLDVEGTVRVNAIIVEGQYSGPFPPPAFDSGWHEVALGSYIDFGHNLGGNVDKYVVDLQMKEYGTGINNRGVGGDACYHNDLQYYGAFWENLTTSSIRVRRMQNAAMADQIRVRIWVYE